MGKTLIGYYEDKNTDASAYKDDVVAHLQSVQAELRSKEANLIEKTSKATSLQNDIASLRRDMSKDSNSPAEVIAMGEALRVLTVRRRAALSEVYYCQYLLNKQKVKESSAQRLHEDITDELVNLATQIADATTRADRLERLRTTFGEEAGALSTYRDDISSEATAYLSGDDYTNAESRVTGSEADIPESLRDRALARMTYEQNTGSLASSLLASLEDTLDTSYKTDGGLSGNVQEKWTILRRAEAAFEAYVATAQQSYDGAVNQIEDILNSEELTDAQSAMIHVDTGDADSLALDTLRQDALSKEEDYYDAMALLDAKQAEIEEATRTLRISDPYITKDDIDTANASLLGELETLETTHADAWTDLGGDVLIALEDAEKATAVALADYKNAKDAFLEENPEDNPDDDPTVGSLKSTWETKVAEEEAALTAFKETPWYILDAWENAIPISIWHNLYKFTQATAVLEDFRDTTVDPDALNTALDDAEDALVSELETEESWLQSLDVIDEEIMQADERTGYFTNHQSARLTNALMGID